jgi:mercuric ion transport protein
MLANGFMNALVATKYSNQKKAIAVSFVPTRLSHAHRFKKVMNVALQQVVVANMKLFSKLTKFGDITSTLGALVSTMGCAMCFPAIASFASAIGLGFLEQWEGDFLNIWLPFFAWFALAVNLLAWFSHRSIKTTVVMIIVLILLLLSYYPWFKYAWSTYVTYSALVLMVVASIWDMLSKNHRVCEVTNE